VNATITASIQYWLRVARRGSGQIDKDQLFYLTSRGLGPAEAKSLIIEGFLESLVERLAAGKVRDEVSAALEKRLGEIL
jgi:Fe-S cluster assembly protein SufD